MSPAAAVSQNDYAEAIGRTERRRAVIDAEKVDALASALDLDTAPGEGGTLPPGWHWMFFNPFVKRSELGHDGHPQRGGFLPAVELPRRMWAGGRLSYFGRLSVGIAAERESEITDVSAKSGRAGNLVFVTVHHRIYQKDELLVEEHQDIVYREAPQPGAPAAVPAAAPEGARWSEAFHPDATLLFRYSALTSNGHRIHYDQPYATQEEGYPGLVVHGPLISTLLQGLAERTEPAGRLARFTFRGMAPLFVGRKFHLEAAPNGEGAGLSLWARGPDGELAMRADAEFSI